jgi:microcystin-dependent protein
LAETLTTNYSWTKPDPGASANTWGATLNATTDKIDNQVFTNAKAGIPVGSGALWFTSTPPANWLLCQGQSLATTGTYAALFAIIGYAYGGSGANFNLPNFTNFFPVGAGGSYALAGTGGEANHVLTVSELAAHPHPITDVAHNHGVNQSPHNHGDPSHNHGASGSQDAHSHGLTQSVIVTSGSGATPGGSAFSAGSPRTDTQQPNVYVSVAGAYTGIQAANANVSLNASGTGLSTTQNAGGGAGHNNLPPFLGINFIIKFV